MNEFAAIDGRIDREIRRQRERMARRCVLPQYAEHLSWGRMMGCLAGSQHTDSPLTSVSTYENRRAMERALGMAKTSQIPGSYDETSETILADTTQLGYGVAIIDDEPVVRCSFRAVGEIGIDWDGSKNVTSVYPDIETDGITLEGVDPRELARFERERFVCVVPYYDRHADLIKLKTRECKPRKARKTKTEAELRAEAEANLRRGETEIAERMTGAFGKALSK